MTGKRFYRGKIAILLGVLTMLAWNSVNAIPVAILFMAFGVFMILSESFKARTF